MKFFSSFGMGGKGMFEGRPNDKFGVGFYFINVNNPTIQGPFQTRKLLRDEYGLEAFYNIAITPWLQLTPDLQVIQGAQKDKLTLVQGPLGLLPRIERNSIRHNDRLRSATAGGVLRRLGSRSDREHGSGDIEQRVLCSVEG